ncbi:hypothetical protein LINGRAHAP2_LOCUS11591 [Linum grandiflorum]
MSPNISGIPIQPLYPCNSFEKMFPAFRDGVVTTTASGSIFSENNNRYPHDVGGSNSGGSSSHCLVHQETSSEFITLDAAASPTVQGLSGVTIADSSTGCALSLLSSQSQSSSSGQSSRIPMAGHHRSLLVQNNDNKNNNYHYGMNQQQVSGRMIGFGSQTNPPIHNTNHGIIYQGSHFTNSLPSSEDGEDTATIDLLQLSSQLHRVEREKQQSLQQLEQDDAEVYLLSSSHH